MQRLQLVSVVDKVRLVQLLRRSLSVQTAAAELHRIIHARGVDLGSVVVLVESVEIWFFL